MKPRAVTLLVAATLVAAGVAAGRWLVRGAKRPVLAQHHTAGEARAPRVPRPTRHVAIPSTATPVSRRPRDEWQGMQVDYEQQAECDGEASCGLAMACLDGRCAPCVTDDQCATGETCVLEHCVRRELASCHHAGECGDSPCVLSGYSDGVRGNETMRSYCSTPETSDSREPAAAAPIASGQRGRDIHTELRERFRDELVP